MTDRLPHRPTVWVVDDSPIDWRRAQEALAPHYDLEHFADGSAVLERLGSEAPPQVLVLDWLMPGVTGIEVVHFMRASKGDRVPEVPILLLTGQQRPEQISEGLNAGANDYLSKPYAAEELQARIAALLRSAALYERTARAERAVREILFASPDALVAIDVEGRVLLANSEAGRVFGSCEAELIGQSIAERFPDLAEPLRSGRSGSAEPDVTIGSHVYAPSVRVLETGDIHRVLALRDVTERRRVEERRLDLYSIAAHDLRSPLGALLLRADHILDGARGPLEAVLRTDIEKMRGSSQRMVAIIDDFLDLARFEGEAPVLRRGAVDLAELIAMVSEDLRPLAIAKQIALEVPASTQVLSIVGDPARLGQVITNLVSNAIKFSPPGTAVIVAGRDLAAEDVVEVSVTDEGPGIAPEAIATLFDRFTRVETGAATAGTGLGLMIVRQIVEAHGGRALVESTVGRGSRFSIRLPRAAR